VYGDLYDSAHAFILALLFDDPAFAYLKPLTLKDILFYFCFHDQLVLDGYIVVKII
jgi:hypothetical protein